MDDELKRCGGWCQNTYDRLTRVEIRSSFVAPATVAVERCGTCTAKEVTLADEIAGQQG
jgi:hypothetical protein